MIKKIFRFISIKILYIFLIFIGIFSEKFKFKLCNIFLKINNYWTIKFIKTNKNLINKKILILIPHCLQYSKCIYKITFDIKNCRKCMKCVIGEFLNLQEKYENIFISVATGGTLARKKIKEVIPFLIVAVACERDLTNGIFDAYPFFVYGIFNSRPNGDCIDTNLDFKKVIEIINKVYHN